MATATYTPAPLANAFHIDVDVLERNPFQPRLFAERDEDLTPEQAAALDDLGKSIEATEGVLQPILVRPIRDRNGAIIGYQIVDGERRWRASKRIGRGQIKAVVEELNDEQVMYATFVANDQREDLTDYEKSQHFLLIARKGAESGHEPSEREIARRLGRSTTYVRNRFELLKLPEDVVKVAERRSQVMSSLFEVAKIPDATDRKALLIQIDRERPAAYRPIKKQVDDVLERIKTQKQSRSAPDTETAQRSATNAQTGGGNVSRGHQVKGASAKESQQQVDALLSRMNNDFISLQNWLQATPSIRGRNATQLEKLAQAMLNEAKN